MTWYKCDRCGHETFSEDDITGEECIAGSFFVADPELQKIRDEKKHDVRCSQSQDSIL